MNVINEDVDFEESLNSDTKFINIANTLANKGNSNKSQQQQNSQYKNQSMTMSQ